MYRFWIVGLMVLTLSATPVLADDDDDDDDSDSEAIEAIEERLETVENRLQRVINALRTLQGRMDSAEERLDTLEASVAANTDSINLILSDISVAQTNIATLLTEINNLELRLELAEAITDNIKIVPNLSEETSASMEGLTTGDLVYSESCTFFGVTREFCIGRMTSPTGLNTIVIQRRGEDIFVGTFKAQIQP